MDQDQGTQHANKNNNHINQQVNGKSIKKRKKNKNNNNNKVKSTDKSNKSR